ncbi:MAG: class I SAM-dependent methyltransferase [Sulfuricaulis sp.]
MVRELFKSSRLFAFNSVNRDAWVRKQAEAIPSGALVLDVGAGSCPYREMFSHCVYKTQDFTQLEPDQLRHGNYGKIDYVSDASHIPVPKNYFDVVLCTEMLEHVPEPVAVIAEFARILKRGGKIILTAPLGSGLHQEPYHYYGGYTPYWYKKYLVDNGFSHIVIEANAGFFKFYSQESLRFLRLSRPFRLGMLIPLELLWAPVWLMLAPFLGIFVPLICTYLDRFDTDRRFTVGYHVTAVKT